jgi:hypothetical protein
MGKIHMKNSQNTGVLEQQKGSGRPKMPLSLLSRLQRVQLPVCVTHPDEVRKISVLLATGLVEAEFSTIPSHIRHAEECVATVTRITEEGLAELETVSGAATYAKPLIRFSGGLRLM